jgi:predicted TIM-barrel fold metal-dependent hydrolase
MIVDSLTYMGSSLLGEDVSATDLKAALDRTGVDVAVVSPMKPPSYHLRAANELVAKAVSESDGRLVGLARVDPNVGESASEDLVYGLEQLGFVGLFLHPWEECFQITSPRVGPLLEIAREHLVPVVIASGYPWVSEALQVASVAEEYPTVDFIATNGGQINISGLGTFDAFLALAGNANLQIQTTGVYRQDFIEEVISRYGPERVLYASGFPYMFPALEILRVHRAECDDAAKADIIGGNAIRAFKLPERGR